MGVSHLAILGAHPSVEIVGVCDTSAIVMGAMEKYSPFPCFTDFRKMLDRARPDAVVIAVPTRFHYDMVNEVLDRGMHVFVEKPFCLDPVQSSALAEKAAGKGLVNQVGYHNKFIGTFREVKRLIRGGYLGKLYHFHGQSHGPVVVRSKQESWRSDPEAGGGCLMDYASHVIDLVNYLLSPISKVESSELKTIFSTAVDDAVFAMVRLENNLSGMISVNWSDDTYRKMTTSITVTGTKGKIISDANELKVYFRDEVPEGYAKGWNVKYVTDLTPQVDYYLRGEEYSLQLDHFISAIVSGKSDGLNNFASAAATDKAIKMIREEQY